MSQLDISIFYSHLITLLFLLYVFAHFTLIILINYYYNIKIRNIIEDHEELHYSKDNNMNILIKILE